MRKVLNVDDQIVKCSICNKLTAGTRYGLTRYKKEERIEEFLDWTRLADFCDRCHEVVMLFFRAVLAKRRAA